MQTVKLDTLYCLDKVGKIRLYEVQTYHSPTHGCYIKKSCTGLLGGNLVYKENYVKIGKQGRTVEEQAVFEITSEWNCKRDEGYKSLSDLSLKAQVMEKDIAGQSISEIFTTLEIKYNTDTRWYPLPMLADKYKTHQKKMKFPMIAQPKLNGVRCIALYDADLQEVVLVSRGGKTYNIPHIQKQLTPFFLVNQNAVLDGEIYVHGKALQELSGAARKGKDAPDWLEYHIYDHISDLPQITRNSNLVGLMQQIAEYSTSIYRVRNKTVNSHEEVMKLHDECVAQGYEGLILREYNSPYMVSFRDKCLLKVKEFEDAEFEIVHCEIDPNKTVGESFVFVLQNDINDATFKARPMGTIKDKEYWYSSIRNLVGKKCTVRFQERTQEGLPHQGHVRSDLSECLKIELVDRQDI